ncbi:MAG: Hpt domain-containing protein, partial [Pseudomonadales bacterium]|nr:Hpt domain-containing protein [Pseudomonadales bacterium]
MTAESAGANRLEWNKVPDLGPKFGRRYQGALVALLRRQETKENRNVMAKVFANLARLCGKTPFGYLAQLNIAVIEGILAGGIKLNNRVSDLMKRMDRELKQLADGGAGALGTVSTDLGQALFDLVQTSTRETPRIRTVRELFEVRVEQEAPSVSMGPDDETLSAVARILKDEFNQITDKLDLYVRASERKPQDLVELLPMLEQISSTMSVVGLTSQQETVQEQVRVIRGIEQSSQEPDEEVLLDMARALLQIESLLGSMAGGEAEEGEDFGDLSEAQASVIRETRSGLAKAKDAVIEFVSSEWNHEKITDLSADLRMLRGGLQIVNQQRAADILLACAEYVDRKLVAGKRVPELSEMDDLADALTSIDYYLERLLESSSDPYLQMIEVAEQAVAKLGFDVDEVLARAEAGEEAPDEEVTEEVVTEEAVADEPEEPEVGMALAEEEETSESAADDIPETLEETVPEEEETSSDEELEAQEAEDVPTLEVEEPLEVAPEEENLVDDEIVEIFVEETQGVLDNVRKYFPRWRDNPGDKEALTEVRRDFHNLKGSGRRVGATNMGEIAWALGTVHNQGIDG